MELFGMRILSGLLGLFFASTLLADTVPVTVKPLAEVWLKRQYEAPASVISINTPQISAEIAAVVSSLPVKVGDIVKKGDVLVSLDCETYRYQQQISAASLQRSAAQLGFARSQLSRAKNLQSKKSISEELLDQRQTELKVAQADYLTQKQNLFLADIEVENCQVKSSLNGVVSERLVAEGDYATRGQPLLTLTDLDAVEVKAALRQTDISTLKAASTIWLDTQGKQFPVTLRTVVPVFDNASATAQGRLVFSAAVAWPGSVGRLMWTSDVSMLPAAYLSRRGEKLGVFYLSNNQAKFLILENAIEGRPAMIDLPSSTAVIIEGRQRLQDGDNVEVVKTVVSKPAVQ